LKVLLNLEEAEVRMPTEDEIKTYQAMVTSKYPDVTDVFGAMDGLKIYLESTKDESTQNMFYNGWKCDHYISNLFLFVPNGKIVACYFNAPGSVHDSTMARISGIYEKIDEVYDKTGGRVVGDSAFTGASTSILRSGQRRIQDDGRPTTKMTRDATSIRQLSEWGMRALQGSFPRIKDRIPYEERGERKFLIQLVILMNNFRAATMGFNQIQTVYAKELRRSPDEFVIE
jgi:hypothetical protein